jgi:hypothetical protein
LGLKDDKKLAANEEEATKNEVDWILLLDTDMFGDEVFPPFQVRFIHPDNV